MPKPKTDLTKFLSLEILEEDEDLTDPSGNNDDGGDDATEEYVPRSKYEADLEAERKKAAKLAAQRNEAREKLKSNQPQQNNGLDESTFNKLASEREQLNKFRDEYPDVNVEEAQKLKSQGYSREHAFKVLTTESAPRQKPASLGGRSDAGASNPGGGNANTITIDALAKLPPHEYSRMRDMIDQGKVKVLDGTPKSK